MWQGEYKFQCGRLLGLFMGLYYIVSFRYMVYKYLYRFIKNVLFTLFVQVKIEKQMMILKSKIFSLAILSYLQSLLCTSF